ncbi:MAG: UDP-2,3-diacylglucosamine diphosphatase [Pseudobdellovibrionaceae bacterium]
MQAWFISDLHLKNINERNSVILLRFLHSLKQDKATTHLFFLGDVFDLWVGSSDVFQKKFQAIVDAIADLKRRGIEVVYFEGNHDVQIKNFWEQKFQIPVQVDAKIFDLGPYQVRLEHGDYINPDDKAYLRYLEFIRNPKMNLVAEFIPGKFFDEVGSFASRLSRKQSSTTRRDSEEVMRERIRTYAQSKARESEFDYIITGHMHVRDEFEFDLNSKKKISINLGSWFETPKALRLTEAGHSWVQL